MDGSPTTATVAVYGAVIFLFALLTAWPAPCCNNPVFAEIVPPRQRNLVYSFDRAFESKMPCRATQSCHQTQPTRHAVPPLHFFALHDAQTPWPPAPPRSSASWRSAGSATPAKAG